MKPLTFFSIKNTRFSIIITNFATHYRRNANEQYKQYKSIKNYGNKNNPIVKAMKNLMETLTAYSISTTDGKKVCVTEWTISSISMINKT